MGIDLRERARNSPLKGVNSSAQVSTLGWAFYVICPEAEGAPESGARCQADMIAKLFGVLAPLSGRIL